MRIVISICLLALPAAAETALDDAAVLTPRPVVSEIVNAEAADAVSFVGVVAARTETDLGFPLDGTLVERRVETGDLVASGDILARLDTEDLDAQQRAAEAGVAVATARLRSAQAEADRASALSSSGADSKNRLEDAERALTAAKAALEQAKATLAQAEDLQSLAKLSAPQDGVILTTYADVGASVTAGQPVVRLAQAGGREVQIDVTERAAAGLNETTGFAVTLVANPEVSAHATLRRIDPVAVASTRTRKVHLTLQDSPDGFRLGALLRVRLLGLSDLYVSLDANAILESEGSTAVWVVDRKTDTVTLRPVTLGETFGSRVRIADGLATGEEVVLKGIHSLQEGQTVGPSVSK